MKKHAAKFNLRNSQLVVRRKDWEWNVIGHIQNIGSRVVLNQRGLFTARLHPQEDDSEKENDMCPKTAHAVQFRALLPIARSRGP